MLCYAPLKFYSKNTVFKFGFFLAVSYCEEARNGPLGANLAVFILVDPFWFLMARFPLQEVCLWRGFTVLEKWEQHICFLQNYFVSKQQLKLVQQCCFSSHIGRISGAEMSVEIIIV